MVIDGGTDMTIEKVTDTDMLIIEVVNDIDMLIIEKVTDGEIIDRMNDCDIDIGGENVPPIAGGTITSTTGLVHRFGRARLPATTPLPATTVWIA